MSAICEFARVRFNLLLCVRTFATLSLYRIPEVHPLPRVPSKMEHYCFKQAHNVPVQQKTS